ncbi:fibronectin type III domain-containing protein, partial [Candidatus Marithioploca araucensis]|nr:fibronectin type III domain-containing protein [Candidatus Marithioploca araucensis]
MKKLVFLLLLCLTQTVGATAELTFSPLKPTYHVGECVFLKLQENLQAASRFHRVDLWTAVKLPDDNLLFMTPLAFAPFSPNPQLFRKSLEATKRVHDILDFEVVEGLSGTYTFYAAYVKEGKNPMTDSFSVLQSNLAEVSTTLSDEPPLIPVVDCVSVLPAPSNPFAEAGDTSVVLSWEPVTDAASYVVYWQASDGSGASLSVTATSFMHEGLINGVSYSYWVTAMDTMGIEGITSITVAAIPKAGVTPPSAPTVLSAEAGNAQVVFTWQAVTGAASYTVYWQSAGGAVESRSVSGTVFTHNGLVNGT